MFGYDDLSENKYPIKYAILKLSEQGDWFSNYKDITRGYIVSKCYVIKSSISYFDDGSYKVVHEVVFPFNDLEMFKWFLKNGHAYAWKREKPKYDINKNVYPISTVLELYDTYDEAKEVAQNENALLMQKKILEIVNETTFISPEFSEELKEKEASFTKELAICREYEKMITEETEDMIVTQNEEVKLVRKK